MYSRHEMAQRLRIPIAPQSVDSVRSRIRSIAICLSLVFGIAAGSAADVGTPEWIVETFFSQDSFPDAGKYYTGEMEHYVSTPPMGQFAAPGYTLTKRLLESTRERTVWAVCYDYPEPDQDRDWYAFLVYEGESWKLSAVRKLALPGFLDQLFAELKQKASLTPEEAWVLAQTELLYQSDADLKVFWKAHRAALQEIANALLQADSQVVVRGEKLAEESQRVLWEQLHTLHLNVGRKTSDGLVEINIGGIMDNGVGFIYVPPGKKPPRMSEGNFILVDPIDGGWYLYKTT